MVFAAIRSTDKEASRQTDRQTDASFSPLDIIVVAQVVALLLLLCVVQHHHRGVEVDDLPCGQQVKVGAAVPPTVAVPVQCCCEGETDVQLRSVH